jgi:signal recognition particle subunit SRP54
VKKKENKMFESLSQKLGNVFNNLTKKGVLNEKDIDASLKEIRLVLLEADVNFKVVKEFCMHVKQKAIGAEIMRSLNPAQQMIKVVNDELTALLGGGAKTLELSGKHPVIMLVGLQGSGKTTATAKLGVYFKKQGHRPLLVGADTYRAAAVEQLKSLSKETQVDFFSEGNNPVNICRNSIKQAEKGGNDIVILDTAGRLHIDDEMMSEIETIKKEINPQHVLLVTDAMTGQEAVNVAAAFNEKVGLDGLIMTKLDGDARGGAALSVKKVTGVPIIFAGVGEKTDKLEQFYPDRMASRILGMGDVLTLIEKTQEKISAEDAKKMEEKLRKQAFTLEDLLSQMKEMQKMGGISEIISMLPGANKIPKELVADDKQIKQMEAIILSMTPKERQNPQIISGSHRRRIAEGSGTTIQAVNNLLKQHIKTKKLLAMMSNKKRKLPFGKGFPFQI